MAHPLRILIVDADARACEALRRLVRPVLSRDSLLVACARAEDALTLVRRVEFDVILCAAHLPQMDGLGFCAALERTMPDLAKRTILITDGRLEEAFFAHPRVLAKASVREELLFAVADVTGESLRAAS
jgi:CheY-like chemotaxis protein